MSAHVCAAAIPCTHNPTNAQMCALSRSALRFVGHATCVFQSKKKWHALSPAGMAATSRGLPASKSVWLHTNCCQLGVDTRLTRMTVDARSFSLPVHFDPFS